MLILSKIGVETIWDIFLSKEMYPPSSLDLNLLDCYVWDILKREANKHAHNTVNSPRAAILEAVANMDMEFLIKACIRLSVRLEAIVKAGGD